MEHEVDQVAVIDIVLKQAKVFLEDAGEFFPFGAAITDGNEIVTVGVKLDDEHPRVNEVLDYLTSGINNALQNGRYIFAALGVNVTLTRNEKKHDALEIQLMKLKMDTKKVYYAYEKYGDVYTFTLVE
jgi:hypothetical protein